MHYGRAHTISIEEEEDGFTLTLEGLDEGDGIVRVNIQDVAVDLRKAVREHIDPWWAGAEGVLAEMKARGVFACDPDESAEYALDDPKHPTYHERMSAIHDNRPRLRHRWWEKF